MIEIFLKYFIKVFKNQFPDEICPTMKSFLILTSSNDKKEIFHIHGPLEYGFFDVYHFKSMLKMTLDEMKKDKINDKLLVHNIHEDRKVSFVYLGLYHENTCFRMYYCTKVNDYRPMIVSKLNQYKLEKTDEEIFQMTIINNVPKENRILKIDKIELLKSIAPKIYNNETKEIIDILRSYKPCETKNVHILTLWIK